MGNHIILLLMYNVCFITSIGWDLLVEASLKPVWHLSQMIYVYLFDILCLLHCLYQIVYYVHIIMYLTCLLHVMYLYNVTK